MARAIARVMGAFWLISGLIQLPLGIGIALLATDYKDSILLACAYQMSIFSIGGIVIGAILLSRSNAIARFAAKGASDA